MSAIFGRCVRATGLCVSRGILGAANQPISSRRTFIYRQLDDVKAADMVKVMPSKACESRRYLLRKDGMGFSFHETVLYKGHKLFIHYVNHLEAVFITKGSGWIELVDSKDALGSGKRFKLEPGTMYALSEHEKHWLGCDPGQDMYCICVFVPPCDGSEVQNEDGVFPFIGKDGQPDYNFWKHRMAENKPVKITLETGYGKKKLK